MAGFSFDLDDSIFGGLLETDFEEIAKECLTEAAPILEESMKRQVRKSVEHSGESEMINSIKARKARRSKNGDLHIFVGPSGYSAHTYSRGKEKRRTYPVSNALKAIWLEYGIQHPQHHQRARPFITASVNACKEGIYKRMQEVYSRKVDL